MSPVEWPPLLVRGRLGVVHIDHPQHRSAAACRNADRSSRPHSPKSLTTLLPNSSARSPISRSRPSITSEADAGFCSPYKAFIHSSFVRRSACASTSSRRAAVVLPVAGSPTVRKSVGCFITPPANSRDNHRRWLAILCVCAHTRWKVANPPGVRGRRLHETPQNKTFTFSRPSPGIRPDKIRQNSIAPSSIASAWGPDW